MELLATDSFFTLNYLGNWNLILLSIFTCSILSFTIFFERLYRLKMAQKEIEDFFVKIKNSIEIKDFKEAISICNEMSNALAAVVKAGLLKGEKDRATIEQAMELQGRIEISKLEKNAKILSMIAHITPLIGLLGTVIGFIQVFSEMRLSVNFDINAARMGEALEFALVTTAAGLSVAIPTLVAYHYLAARIESFILEIETSSLEIIDLMIE